MHYRFMARTRVLTRRAPPRPRRDTLPKTSQQAVPLAQWGHRAHYQHRPANDVGTHTTARLTHARTIHHTVLAPTNYRQAPHRTSTSCRFFFFADGDDDDDGDDEGDGPTAVTLTMATLAGDTVVPAPDTAAAACSFTFANDDGSCTFRRFFLSPCTTTPDVTAKPVIVVFDDVDDVTDVLANPSTAARTSTHTQRDYQHSAHAVHSR